MIGQRGAWINQYAVPTLEQFASRTPSVDYLIIKCDETLRPFAQRCGEIGKPWLAEIYPYQQMPAHFGTVLGEWADNLGCVGAVVNFEDINWDTDTDGSATNAVIDAYKALTALPLYAALDTRGERSNDAYQRVCIERCTGVMPMVYPGAFGQSVEAAYAAAINQTMVDAWSGKPIMPVLQTYDNIGADSVGQQCTFAARFPSHSAYTLGHASDSEWAAFIAGPVEIPPPVLPKPQEPQTTEQALTVLMDNIIVPLAFGWNVTAQNRLRYLYALAGRTLPNPPTEDK